MTHAQLVAEAKALLSDAYERAAWLIVEYLDSHPREQLRPLCREIDPDNWNALRNRVQRAQKARDASAEAESAARAQEAARIQRVHAKTALRTPKQRKEVLDSLSASERIELARDLAEDDDVRDELADDYKMRETVAGKKRSERSGRRETQVGLPFDHLLNTVSMRATQWTAELRQFYDELDTIPKGADRERLGREFRALGDQAYRWANRLEGTDKGVPALELIEGKVSA